MADLTAHDVPAAYQTTHHRLVQDEKEQRRVISVQLFLAPHPDFHQRAHAVGRGPLFDRRDDSAGVVLGLKKAWNQQRFEVPDNE